MTAEPLRVELLVCPDCRRVGKIPLGGTTALKGYCTGPAVAPHKKARMQGVPFIEERRATDGG